MSDMQSNAQKRLDLQARLATMAERGKPNPRIEAVPDQLFHDEPVPIVETEQLADTLQTNEKYMNVTLTAGDYNQANLEDLALERCVLTNTRFAGTNLHNASIIGSTLRTVDGAGAVFDGATIADTGFFESRLTGTDFGRTTLSRVTFTETNLTLARFCFAKLSNVTFRDCDLTNTDFQGCKASNIVFERCRLHRTEFSQSTVKSGAIRNCDLELVRGLTFLAGITLDKSAVISLAPAFAVSMGFKVEG